MRNILPPQVRTRVLYYKHIIIDIMTVYALEFMSPVLTTAYEGKYQVSVRNQAQVHHKYVLSASRFFQNNSLGYYLGVVFLNIYVQMPSIITLS